jgi:ATP-dependent Lon protease
MVYLLPVQTESLPILPLRNSVVFPASIVPVNVGRLRSVRLIEQLLELERPLVGVVGQLRPDVDEPGLEDLHAVGTVARIVKVVRLGPQNFSVVLHGVARMRIEAPEADGVVLRARIVQLPDELNRDAQVDGLAASLRKYTAALIEAIPTLAPELAQIVANVQEPGVLADLVAANLDAELLSTVDKQAVLATFEVAARIERVMAAVRRKLDSLKVRRDVSAMVESEGKTQREIILRQQMRNIKEELGEGAEDDEVEALRDRLLAAGLSDDAKKIARKQLGRIANMPPQSAEYNVTRNYLEWLADLPWDKTSPEKIDVEDCRRCLEEDHYGLEKVKKRIIEYMAVRKLRSDKKGPILCFIGPPGVGKTSLGRSIARSMGRRYHRIALGGVRDEAEIRGHRRTYVGALPGRLMQGLKKVGVKNPVLVLDEIDKLGKDTHGDPSSALLEVLDPAQNDTFQDHYIDTSFDLSQVVFIATANSADTIPGPLWDRLEVIEVSGYTREEKRAIARHHLVPKQVSAHGLPADGVEFTHDGLARLIEGYTREAGVRGLDRQIGAVCRFAAMQMSEGNLDRVLVDDDRSLEKILGAPRYKPDLAERTSMPGVATGLAWTPSGGDILFIEATKMVGKGDIRITGNLRSVMQESAHTAVSFVRSRAKELRLDPEFMKHIDLHLHVPKGGTPKDGPSAGVTMFSALTSLLLGFSVKKEVAMTGEITLRGLVLPVGGIKEKLLAAHRAGIREVLIPKKNERDLDEIPADVRKELTVHLVSRMEEILPLVLEPLPATSADGSPSDVSA